MITSLCTTMKNFFVDYQNVIKNIAKYNCNITLMNSLNQKVGVMMDEGERERERRLWKRERGRSVELI